MRPHSFHGQKAFFEKHVGTDENPETHPPRLENLVVGPGSNLADFGKKEVYLPVISQISTVIENERGIVHVVLKHFRHGSTNNSGIQLLGKQLDKRHLPFEIMGCLAVIPDPSIHKKIFRETDEIRPVILDFLEILSGYHFTKW